MQLYLGDYITIAKGETWVTGHCTGIVLDERKELSRLYIQGIETAFWMSDGWKVADEEEEPTQNEED